MTCVYHRLSAKSTSVLLSVAPRTVETHIRNIKDKLKCSSQDGIIDFIENFGCTEKINDYYKILLIDQIVKRDLESISNLVQKKSLLHFVEIIFTNNDTKFYLIAKKFKDYLHHINIISKITQIKNIEKIEDYIGLNDTLSSYYLIFVDREFIKLSTDEKDNILERSVKKFSDKVLLITDFDPTETSVNIKKNCLSIFNDNYHLTFFEVIKKLLPQADLDTIIENFRVISLNPEKNTIKEKFTFFYLKKFFIPLLSIFSIFILFIFYHFSLLFSKVIKTYENEKVIHSKLIITSQNILLKRSKLIDQINEIFEKCIDSQGVVLLSGIGGCGKTTLARYYANSKKFSVIWEINAENKTSLLNSFKELAYALVSTKQQKEELSSIQETKNTEERNKRLVNFVKNELRKYQNWFLIYDNVEDFSDLKSFFPYDIKTWGSGKVIVTTRNSNIKNTAYFNAYQVIELGELSNEESLELFNKILYGKNMIDPSDHKDTIKFLENIPPFPLDISIVAYYIKNSNLKYEKYLEKIKNPDQNFVSEQLDIMSKLSDYKGSRHSIIQLSIENILKISPNFTKMLFLICLLDSQNIPKDLIEECDEGADLFISYLKKYSLITNYDKKMQHISIHRSSQKIGLEYLVKKLSLNNCVDLTKKIEEIIEKYILNFVNNKNCIKAKIIPQHCEKFLQNKNLMDAETYARLSGELGVLYCFFGEYEKSKKLLEQAINNLQEKHTTKLARYNAYLGSVIYKRFGDHKKAINLLDKAMLYCKKTKKIDHKNLSFILMNMGICYREIGDYKKSLEYLQESLEETKHICPRKYNYEAKCLSYLGAVNAIIANYKESEVFFNKSIDIYEKHCFSQNYTDYPWALLYFSKLKRSMGNYKEALDLAYKSLGIYKEHLSNNNVNTLWCDSHIAYLLRKLNNHSEAIKILKKNINSYESNNLQEHINKVWSLIYLGTTLADLGDFNQAVELLEQGAEIFKKKFSEKHVETLWAYTHLGKIYHKIGNYKKSQELIELAYDNFKKTLPNQHPLIIWSLTSLVNLYIESGLKKDCIKLLEENFEKFSNLLGDNNIRTAWALANLGNAYLANKNYQKAYDLLNKSMKMHNLYYNKIHLKSLWIAIKLGYCHLGLKNYDEAKKIFKNSFYLYDKYYIKNKLLSSHIIIGLAMVYLEEKSFYKAESLLKDTLNQLQKINHPLAYKCLELLSDLYIAKAQSSNFKKNSNNLIKKAKAYIEQSLEIITTKFPKDSEHLERIQQKIKSCNLKLQV